MGSKLGRGLDSLLRNNTGRAGAPAEDGAGERKGLLSLDVASLVPGKYQPRKDMSPESLEELAGSVRRQGVVQPVIVRKTEGGKYEIVAGERRWRAAKMAGLAEIPCLLRDMSDRDAMIVALVENIQRENLNAMEESESLERLARELDLTHEALADALGKSRSAVSNLIRLGALAGKTKDLLREGKLEMGHARALLALGGELQEKTALAVARRGLTVRDTENLVKRLLNPSRPPEKESDGGFEDLRRLVKSRFAGLSVRCVSSGNNRGRLVLSYKNAEELQKIKGLLGL